MSRGLGDVYKRQGLLDAYNESNKKPAAAVAGDASEGTA